MNECLLKGYFPADWKFAKVIPLPKSTLLPCTNCGRTFYPDRLLVHQRSCKTPQINSKVPSSEHLSSISPAMMSQNTSSTPSGAQPPPTFECYICGKVCGVHSIKIHEKLCLRRWHTENELLPPDMRSPPPVKREKIKSSEPPPIAHGSSDIDEAERPSSSRNSPLFPCYICGKLFTVNSIYIHEPQCLEKWKIENDKLPLIKRRPQPLKPDVKFTRERGKKVRFADNS
ncbi:hypothetical protein JTB14_010210 [Gonioctena quinquepunctata]|nr:hypothetical protein JTB14_010210 [Gonioctena quinquepunctata]